MLTVLYEDSLASKPTSYGPHSLLLACVADKLGWERWDKRLTTTVLPSPKNGDSRLRAALANDARRLADAGGVAVLFDLDRVRDCYRLPSTSCIVTVLDAIAEGARVPIKVVLLDRNMETLVAACATALRVPCPPKVPRERDRILNHAADADLSVRVQVLAGCKTFERLVDIVHAWVREQAP
jgi:hypothetical protein